MVTTSIDSYAAIWAMGRALKRSPLYLDTDNGCYGAIPFMDDLKPTILMSLQQALAASFVNPHWFEWS